MFRIGDGRETKFWDCLEWGCQKHCLLRTSCETRPNFMWLDLRFSLC